MEEKEPFRVRGSSASIVSFPLNEVERLFVKRD